MFKLMVINVLNNMRKLYYLIISFSDCVPLLTM